MRILFSFSIISIRYYSRFSLIETKIYFFSVSLVKIYIITYSFIYICYKKDKKIRYMSGNELSVCFKYPIIEEHIRDVFTISVMEYIIIKCSIRISVNIMQMLDRIVCPCGKHNGKNIMKITITHWCVI